MKFNIANCKRYLATLLQGYTLMDPSHYQILESLLDSVSYEMFHQKNSTSPISNDSEFCRFSKLAIDGKVALIEIDNVIVEKFSFWSWLFDFVDCENLILDLEEVKNNKEIELLILRVNSPGGEVDGVQNVSETIYNMRKNLNTLCIIDSLAASAGYWIGSSCEYVGLISETASAGSIGVAYQHTDISKMLEMRGVRVTHITAGKWKRLGNQENPITDEELQLIKKDVLDIYDIFTKAVSKNRNMEVSDVVSRAGDGRVYLANVAVQRGLADGILNFSNIVGVLNMSGKLNLDSLFKAVKVQDDKDKEMENEETEEEMEDEETEEEMEDEETEEEMEDEEEDEEVKDKDMEDEEEDEELQDKDEKSVKFGVKAERERVSEIMSFTNASISARRNAISSGISVNEFAIQVAKGIHGTSKTPKKKKKSKKTSRKNMYSGHITEGHDVRGGFGHSPTKKVKSKVKGFSEEEQDKMLVFVEKGGDKYKAEIGRRNKAKQDIIDQA